MASGDIGGPVDTLEFALTDITHPDMVHVSDDIYAIAYTDINGDGMVATVDIAANGQIGATVVDTLKFDAVDGHHPSMVHVVGDIYAIAYRGVDADGFLVTVEISTAGVMGAAVEDSLEFETNACYEPSMILVGSGMVAIVCRGNASQGVLTTVGVAADGQINPAYTDKEESWATNIKAPQIINVSGGVYAIVSRDNVYDGWLHTIGITAAGEIDANIIDSLEFDAATGNDPCICQALGNIFVIAYRGGGDTGVAVTIEISTAGTIGAAVGDSLEFEATRCTWPDIIHIGNGICAIAYGGELDDGYVTTIQTDAAGLIDNTVIDTNEFDPENGTQPSMVHIDGDTYAIAYIGGYLDGFVSTPTISTPGAISYLMMMGIGS